MSETSSASKFCQKCGATLPVEATAGLCPACLMAGVMVPTDSDSEPATPRKALSPAELAPHFPQLEILECLGRGGMGVVYKARQKALNRLVALKLLAPERVSDPQFAERFTREAQALATLSHTNIVTVHDFGQAGGFYYLLMEFVDGVNLRQAMKAARFTPEQALAIVPPVCEALQYAHEHGIVHRDIKPENLLLDKEGRVKIADFGIAKMLGGNADTPVREGDEVRAGVPALQSETAGTPQYMAPEQKHHRRTDHRADIYSLGVVLYELLTGELPGKPLEAPSKKVVIDVRLDEIVLRALEANPERRYQTAAEVRTQVETVVSTPPPAGVPASAGSQQPPQSYDWQSPTSGWGWLIGKVFGFTFTSPLAYKCANLSALGFLGSLGFLREAPFPGAQLCVGFFGLYGLFGLIGLAHIIEFSHRRKAKRITNRPSQLPITGKAGAGSSASQSLIQDIRAHLTADEKRTDMLCGILEVAGIMCATFGTIHLGPVAMFGFILFILATGWHLKFLASTAYARQQGITIEQLRHAVWTAKLRRLRWLAILVAALLAVFLGYRLMQHTQYDNPRKEPPREPELIASVPEIESVVITKEQAVVKQREFHGEALSLMFGPMSNRWDISSAYFDHLFDVTLQGRWFSHGADWVVKPRHTIYANYRLDGPPGPMLGKIVFHPGTPAAEADGYHVIGEFRPEKGEPLPIAVRLVRDSKPSASPSPRKEKPVTPTDVREHPEEWSVKAGKMESGLIEFSVVRTLSEPKHLVAQLKVHHAGKVIATSETPLIGKLVGKKHGYGFHFTISLEDIAESTFDLHERGFMGNTENRGEREIPLTPPTVYQFRLRDFVPAELTAPATATLKPVPPEAAARIASLRAWTDTFMKERGLHEDAAQMEFAKESARRTKEITSLLMGTVAEPLVKEQYALFAQLKEAGAVNDIAKKDALQSQLKVIREQIDKLAMQSHLPATDVEKETSSPKTAHSQGAYDYRTSEAYRKLSPDDREKLEQVHRDFLTLWKALNEYADSHTDNPPDSLDELVRSNRELPADPFATAETARQTNTFGYVSSKGGWGYRYKRGVRIPGNQSWCLASVGLPDFPYLAEKGNIGLYVCRGVWDGNNVVFQKPDKTDAKAAGSKSPRLQFRLVADANDTASADMLVDPDGKGTLRVRKEILLDETAVSGASIAISPENKASVVVEFNRTGSKRFGEITGANIGKRLAVVLDGKVLAAPTIRSVIHDKAVITGNFTASEVADTILRALSSQK